ncbi:polysaccharide deacetylase family protein [Pontibacter sp. 13R65]|uniref:polysaccharide deacetylase family protein n=1 Tax=Pontibacter sp. 13R65 TaxID=3127458 RepID=UPI00301CB2E7
MYHRIAEPKSDVWDIAVSPTHFEAHLQVLSRLGNVVPLQALAEGVKNRKLKRNSIAITFDDGYQDNYLVAKPLLEKYGLPATFFVSTGNIGETKEFWWDELEEIILYAPLLPARVEININGQLISSCLSDEAILEHEVAIKHQNWNACQDTPPTKRSLLFYELWKNLRPLPVQEQQQCLDEIRKWTDNLGGARSDYFSMTTAQLKELSGNSLFTIGAHTVTHVALAHHTKEIQQLEIQNNIKSLQQIIGKSIELLAYPYGNYNEETVEIAENLNFNAAFTTEEQAIITKTPAYQMGRFQVANWDREVFSNKLRQWIQ